MAGMSVVVEGAEQLWPTRPVIIGMPPTNLRAGGGAPAAQANPDTAPVVEAGG
jgi:hypothetical protein